jgi:CBS domain-containing protein
LYSQRSWDQGLDSLCRFCFTGLVAKVPAQPERALQQARRPLKSLWAGCFERIGHDSRCFIGQEQKQNSTDGELYGTKSSAIIEIFENYLRTGANFAEETRKFPLDRAKAREFGSDPTASDKARENAHVHREAQMTSETWGGGSEARRVRVYLSEEDAIGTGPAQHAIVAFLRRNSAAGVTVLRGMEGFGGSGREHSSRVVEVAWDLPIVIEWVDTLDRVNELLPQLKQMVPAGMITVDPTQGILFSRRSIRPLSEDVPVASVMTKDVATVRRDTPIRDVVELMRKRSLRAVPVIDNGVVVGIITNSDLVKRAKLGVRLSLFPGLPANEQARHMDGLPQRIAQEIMTSPPVVVAMNAPLSEAAETMVRRKLKRLPVVGKSGELVGIISRLDLLRTVADFGTQPQREPVAGGLGGDALLSSVMREDVPTVFPNSPLNEVVQAVVSTRLNRALVVDADRKVLGLVTARAVLERVTPALHPHLLQSLMHRLPFLRPSAGDQAVERHASAHKAADLMTTDLVRAHPNDRLQTIIATMVEGGQKLVAVVDDDGRLLGVVDRADVLRGILDHAE